MKRFVLATLAVLATAAVLGPSFALARMSQKATIPADACCVTSATCCAPGAICCGE